MPIIVAPAVVPGSGLDLRAIYINDAADPADFLAISHVGDGIAPTTHADVEARALANRIRLIRKGGIARSESLDVTLRRLTSDQVDWLKEHTGRLVCIRDHVGGKFYGVWTSTPREIPSQFADGSSVVKLQITEITHAEAV